MTNEKTIIIEKLKQLLTQNFIEIYREAYDPEVEEKNISSNIIHDLKLIITTFINLIKNNRSSQEDLLEQLSQSLLILDRSKYNDQEAFFISFYLDKITYTAGLEDTNYKILYWECGEDKGYWYRLRNAVYSKNFEEATHLLHIKPSLINIKNRIGETVLHFLAVENDLEGVEWLYHQGFSLDNKTEITKEPIIFEIASLGYLNLIKWFHDQGADFSATDYQNRNIIEYLTYYHENNIGDYSETIKYIQQLKN
ncbi:MULTISPECIES: hypothetical protein [unclassified Acinetobacter]|uniref:hypothetical protein n=1 Tax=unclassified Acinetobacter TaxID=196816 RepID=UPI0025779E3A|nr:MULTISPECIES: hypothetical protein [unclassified Acinetobacter]MDM1763361.1 hypothetical protein [Acinetobacter sp. 226-1]MDM1766840.1 hypothetical protein [Acinetobacter sp. 226-4]